MTKDELRAYLLQNRDGTELDLSKKEITELPPEIGQLANLQSLGLSGNQLTALPTEIGQLRYLQTLHIGSNQLTTLPLEIGNLANLQTLFLYNNQLTALPPEIGQLANLRTLSLPSNKLTTLPKGIGRLENLKFLNLGDKFGENQLTDLPSEIGELANLQTLSLVGNLLTTLPPEISHLANLQTLFLGGNRLTALPPDIGRLADLQVLELWSNKLTDLPKEIGQLAKLQIIDLSYNQLTALPPEIGLLANLQKLDLGSNQLTALPKEIGLLVNLQLLDLMGNQLTSLPPEIGQLINLQILELYYNQLIAMPTEIGQLPNLNYLNIEYNQLTELPHEIGLLANLQKLDLGSNQLIELPHEIGQLANLQTLLLERNKLKALPPEIGKLANLQNLNLRGNQLTALPTEVGCLANLQIIDLRGNKLMVIPTEIGHLANLQTLDLWGNYLKELPPGMKELRNLKELNLWGNPLETPPPEITRKGIEAIREYFRQVEDEGSDRIYEAKLLIVGEPGAGKTSLAKKILNPKYKLRKDEGTTKGIEVFTWNFPSPKGQDFKVNLWDFGGQEIYHATHQFFLTKRSLYALVADTRKEDTDFYYWLKVVELLSDNSPLLIILNEKQNRRREINEHQLRGQFSNLKEALPTNLADNRGLDRILEEIKHQITTLPHVGASLPKTWVEVRKALENDPRNYMELPEYLELCQKHGFSEPQDKLQLSGYLHDLGVCLHFQDDPILKRTVILKPEWGTAAVYMVLDNPTVINNLGHFTREDLSHIWSGAEYTDRQDELLQLMIKFKLCYEIPSSPGNFIAPQLLSENQPVYTWDETGNLFLRYSYEFMPKGILTRFIVEMHPWIADQKLVWRSGAVLEKDATRAEVVEFYGQRAIKIRVSGKHRKELLTIVIHELDKIHASYHRLKYQKLIPCNCEKCRQTQEPEFYPFEVLRQFMDERQDSIQCRQSFKMVSVRGLIDDVMERRSSLFPERDASPGFEAGVGRTNVFVSYSHKDKKWLERLQTHLKPLMRGGVIELWDDTRIKTGADWRLEIETALAEAKVAIMLISADFLASDFIASHELPPLLEAAKQEGCRIVPVIVSPCLSDATTELNRFQSVNAPSRPLTAMPEHEQDEVLVKVAKSFLEL